MVLRAVLAAWMSQAFLVHSLKWNHWEKGVEFAEMGDTKGGLYAFRQGLRAAPCKLSMQFWRYFTKH